MRHRELAQTRAGRSAASRKESAAEASADRILEQLYPHLAASDAPAVKASPSALRRQPSLGRTRTLLERLTLVAIEATKWVPLVGGVRVPRNVHEDLWSCLDRVVLRPDGSLHGIQVTSEDTASARRAKVRDFLVLPLLEARELVDPAERAPLAAPPLPLLDVWGHVPGMGCRTWRWAWDTGAWQAMVLDVPENRLLLRLASGGARLVASKRSKRLAAPWRGAEPER